MNIQNNIATDLFYKVRSRFSGLKLGAESGEVTIIPEEARFFDFDYMEGELPLGHISISIAEPNSMKIYFSHDITVKMNNTQKTNWYSFLKELRQFAKRRMLNFDPRDITKDNLDQRDYTFLSQNAKPSAAAVPPIGESIMSESNLYGTKKVSYQKLMDTRLIIKHSKALNDDMVPGSRSRNISALFVENSEGERFKYPFVHLAGARAMQRHVANGGAPYDELGKSITNMSEEIAQLKSFGNYVVRNDLMNSENNTIVDRSSGQLQHLREMLGKLAKQHHYTTYKESFVSAQPIEVPESVVEEYTNKFTVRNFKEDIASVFPVIYRLMKESEIEYDDIVKMTAVDSPVIEANYVDHMSTFEEWVNSIDEDNSIVSSDTDEQESAIKNLQELVGSPFPAGIDGSNAIESLKGIIDDEELNDQIVDVAAENPEQCVCHLIKAWLQENEPEIVSQLTFAHEEDEGSQDEVGDKPTEASEGRDIEQPTATSKKIDTSAIAAFLRTFYDSALHVFPKGPEIVCTMVGKKFGKSAEVIARMLVARMAPTQVEQQVIPDELHRIRQLSGM